MNSVKCLEDRIGIVSALQIIHTNNARNVFLAVDIVFGLERIQFLQIRFCKSRLQIKLDVAGGWLFNLVVIGQTIDFGCAEVNENVMIQLDTVLVGWGGNALALKISTTHQTGVDVIIG